MCCSTLSLYSFVNLEHIVSVILTSQMISNYMKHPVYICIHNSIFFL